MKYICNRCYKTMFDEETIEFNESYYCENCVKHKIEARQEYIAAPIFSKNDYVLFGVIIIAVISLLVKLFTST